MVENHQKIVRLLTAAAVSMALIGCGSDNDDDNNAREPFAKPSTYAGFPVTLAGAEGETSTSYSGQMARHVLREQLKATIKAPAATGYGAFTIFDNYFENTDSVIDDTNIIAPTNSNEFVFKETVNNELGTGKNLSSKMYDPEGSGDPISGVAAEDAAKTLGFPGEKTAAEVIAIWRAHWGADQAGHLDGVADHIDATHGYDYSQLVPKFLMGAVFYNQAVDKYIDENLAADVKPNNEAYKDGAIYTGKEHSWDEGFGYFGAAAHFGELTAKENYEVTKKGKDISQADALALADKDGDGAVSLYTEYNSGPAYYASSFDKDGNSTYGADIMDAWLEGRTVIANAVDDDGVARALTDDERTQLEGFATMIQSNWEMVWAEAAFKYAGESFEEIEKLQAGTETDPSEYYKVWSELKGFMMALQYGGANSKITKEKFEEIDNLIGYGPVLQNGNQVTGLEAGDQSETYTLTAGFSLDDYKANMQQVQVKLDEFYTLKAKQHDNR